MFFEKKEHNSIQKVIKKGFHTMKITGNAPEWAIDLMTQVLKDYNRGVPSEFSWRGTSSRFSNGNTRAPYKYFKVTKNGKRQQVNYWGRVHVRAGERLDDQKLVLLHELAHHILNKTPAGRRQGHTIKFWKLCFELYDRYGVDMEFAYSREKGYKVKATQAYEAHMALKGATV